MDDLIKYRGQWGGKIESGEEMWWTEPNLRLWKSGWSRFLFSLDVRHHFILRFWKQAFSSNQLTRPNLILDYGCGAGGVTLNFSKVLNHPIHGIDIFETQLSIAREFSKKMDSKCKFHLVGEGGKIPFPDQQVDAILSLDVLGHVPDIPATLKEFSRVLKPGGSVLLFTEATFSKNDPSIMAKLARQGADMTLAVPEHISLFPREELEKFFISHQFKVVERFSANVWHFFFFPKDYVLLLQKYQNLVFWRVLASFWNRLSKITPFYPWPFQFIRLGVTYLFGRDSWGTSYFYHLKKI